MFGMRNWKVWKCPSRLGVVPLVLWFVIVKECKKWLNSFYYMFCSSNPLISGTRLYASIPLQSGRTKTSDNGQGSWKSWAQFGRIYLLYGFNVGYYFCFTMAVLGIWWSLLKWGVTVQYIFILKQNAQYPQNLISIPTVGRGIETKTPALNCYFFTNRKHCFTL